MSNIWHDMNPKRITPRDFECVIEITKGSKKKYELDKECGLLRLDRILYTSTHYPCQLRLHPPHLRRRQRPAGRAGALQRGDPAPESGALLSHGVITMLDQGKLDEKIIAIPFKDPTYNSYHDVSDAAHPTSSRKCPTSSPSTKIWSKRRPWWTRCAARRMRRRSSRSVWISTSKNFAAERV